MSAVPGQHSIEIGRQIKSQKPLQSVMQDCAQYTRGEEGARRLDIPSYLSLAGQDRLSPLKAGKVLAEKLKAEYSVIEGYGHMLPIEAPKQCLHRLRESIASLDRAKR